MRVPFSWLREYCAPDLTLEEIEHLLTLSGTKVEAIHHHGVETADSVVVGHIVDCAPHPNADRLKVCTVDIGTDRAATIVCGAANVAAAQTVIVACPGTVMPGGQKIKRAKLRGVASEGMICSAAELAIAPEHDGILVLDDELAATAPGTAAASVVPIADEVIEFEITPNRPDCLGIYGIARELHAACAAPLRSAPWEGRVDQGGATIDGIEVDLRCGDLCPRFTVRAYADVTVGPSPLWLKARLNAAGMRPINNVVDITNYVMLITGQPLHAFDADRVAGGRLVVRRAHVGERVTTLDGVERQLDGEMVVIDDADGPTSIAGVMGGARSEVTAATKRVLIEVAAWDGPNIHRTAGRLALFSEASTRFAKGLAPEQTLWAQALAEILLDDLVGARRIGGTIDVGPFVDNRPDPTVIALRSERVAALLGMDIAPGDQRARLEALGFAVADSDDGLAVTVPAYRRADVQREADLLEEVARFELDRLPTTLPARRGAVGLLSTAQQARRRAVDLLIANGAYEVVGWSLTSPLVADRLRLPDGHPLRAFVVLENPMSEQQSVLRTTLLGSLLDIAAHNVARGQSDLTLLEQGTVYRALPDAEAELPVSEHRGLGCLLVGRGGLSGWGAGGRPKPVDFFAAKGLLEAVMRALRVPFTVRPLHEPFFHPGRGASVHVGPDGDRVGLVGELHPLVARAWEIPEQAATFIIDPDKVAAAMPAVQHYRHVPERPPIRQDIAVVVDDDISAQRLLDAVTAAGGDLLADLRLFDVYRGQQIGAGRVSLALALTFRAEDRTLSEEDIAPVRDRIVTAVEALGGRLRS